jgi:hypothetical protein
MSIFAKTNKENQPKHLYWCIYCKEPHEVEQFQANYPHCTKGTIVSAIPSREKITLEQHVANMRQLGYDIMNIKEFQLEDIHDNDFGFPNLEEKTELYIR